MPKNGTSTRSNLRNAFSIGLIAFAVGAVFSGPVGTILQEVGPLTAALIIAGTIAVAILADILAIAATVGDDAPLNAMASDRVPGAKEALILVRNASRVNSLFSDVIGDVAGTMSGVVATPIIYGIREAYPGIPSSVASMLVIGLISFFTIGGKALEKSFAVKASTQIILGVGKAIHYGKRLFGWGAAPFRRRRPRARQSPRQGSDNGSRDGAANGPRDGLGKGSGDRTGPMPGKSRGPKSPAKRRSGRDANTQRVKQGQRRRKSA